MRPEIAIASAGDRAAWDTYVAGHPEGSPFLGFGWRQVVEGTYGHRPYYLLARQNDALAGVLPLFLFRSPIFGRALVTAPFTSWGSLCADGEVVAQALLEAAFSLAGELGVDHLELKGLTALPEPRLTPGLTPYLNFTLEVDDPEVLWSKRFKGRARTAVRKAEKAGVECRRGHELLEDFYSLMALSMRRLGSPVHSRKLYRSILTTFEDRADILIAYRRGLPLAGYLLIWDRRTLFHLSGATRPGFQKTNANSLLMWEAIRLAHELDVKTFDFGRSPVEGGTARYKEQWGGEGSELCYQYLLVRSKRAPRVDPGNPRYRAAIAVWQRLPLWLTTRVGPLLVGGIP